MPAPLTTRDGASRTKYPIRVLIDTNILYPRHSRLLRNPQFQLLEVTTQQVCTAWDG
jgi:riboflavin biosynthesis pyrimidine reductase